MIQAIKRTIKIIRFIHWFKQIKWAVIAILLLSLFALKPYFHSGFPYTHDGENHLARFANYKLALREGQFPPRWAPNLLNRYGYPVFNYNYPLSNILSLPFSALKINYELTFKLLASLYVVLGLVGMYQLLQSLQLPKKAVLFALTLYGLSPYLYTTILFRGNIGELAAWGLLPWIFVLIEIIKKHRLQLWQMTFWSFLLAAFFLSHNVLVLFSLPLLLIYALIRFGKRQLFWKELAVCLMYAVLLSLWFWLPALAEKHLIILDGADLSVGFSQHFPTLIQLLVSPLRFGFSYNGSIDSLSFSLGVAQIMTTLFASFVLFDQVLRKKLTLNNMLWLKLIILTWLIFLFQLSITKTIWQMIPLAQFIQFPWRLGLFFGLCSALVGGYVFSVLSKKLQLVLWLVLFIQLIAVLRSQPVDYFHRLNRDYDAFSQTTSTLNENLPTSFSYTQIGDWQPTPSILVGQGEIEVLYWKGSDREYRLFLEEVTAIAEPTARFAGWVTYVQIEGSDQWQKVTYIDNPIIQGRLAYELEPGNYLVRSQFTQWTWPRLIGNTLSLVTGLALFLNLSIVYLKTRKQ